MQSSKLLCVKRLIFCESARMHTAQLPRFPADRIFSDRCEWESS